jgi:hypothetical protein
MARILPSGIIVVRRGCKLIRSYPGGMRTVVVYRNRLAALIAYYREA